MADDDNTPVDDYGNPIDTSAAPAPEPQQAGIPEDTDDQRRAKNAIRAKTEGRDINEEATKPAIISNPLEDLGQRGSLEEEVGRSPLNQLTDKLGIGKKVGGLQESIRNEMQEDPAGAGVVQKGSSALRGIYNYLTGQDAASKQDLSGAIQRVNPNGNLDDNVALHTAIAAEQDPMKKDALMSRAVHTAREARAMARAAADENHWGKADALVNEGLKYLPDGTKAEFTRHNNGVVATISHLGSDKSDVINLTPQQYSSWLHSPNSDPDNIMRANGGIVESLRGATQQQRADAGPSATSQAQAPVPDNVMAQREQDLRERAEERKLGAHVAPELQTHSNEIAGQVLDTQLGRYRDMEEARRQLSAGKDVDMSRFGNAGTREDYVAQAEKAIGNIRRDKDGNLWTQDNMGRVVPYNTQTADHWGRNPEFNPKAIPRSVASQLGEQERVQAQDRVEADRRARSPTEHERNIDTNRAYDAEGHAFAPGGYDAEGLSFPPGGGYDAEGHQPQPQQQPQQQQRQPTRRFARRRRRQ